MTKKKNVPISPQIKLLLTLSSAHEKSRIWLLKAILSEKNWKVIGDDIQDR